MIEAGLSPLLKSLSFCRILALSSAGQCLHAGALDGLAVGAVAVGAGGGQVARQIRIGGVRDAGCRQQAQCGDSDG